MDAHDAASLFATFGGLSLGAVIALVGYLLKRAIDGVDGKLNSLTDGQAQHSRRLGKIETRLGLESEPPLQPFTPRHEKG